jgi:hypothetical protein
VGACAVLCILVAWAAGVNNSVTFDETLHAVSAHAARHDRDFRLNPEDPPLWMYLANLPHERSALPIRMDDPSFIHVIQLHGHHWDYCSETLFQPGGTKESGHAFVAASRLMMVPLAGVVVVLAAVVAWKLGGGSAGGGIAACLAAVLVAAEPTLLGHGSIVKNDVVMSGVWLGLVLALMGLGKRLTVWRVILVSVCVGLGPCVKFTGVLGAQLLVLAMVARVLVGGAWEGAVFGRRFVLTAWWQRALAGGVITLFAAVVTVTMIWAVYGFRFAATADPDRPLLNTPEHVMTARKFTAVRQFDRVDPTEEQMAGVTLPLAIRGALWAEERQLLPQSWLTGFVYTYASTMYRVNFMLGEPKLGGRWYYFLVVPFFKLPLGLLAVWGMAAAVGVQGAVRGGVVWRGVRWEWVAAWLGLGLYLAIAMTSDMNIGVRHILPIIPLASAMAAAGVAAVFAMRSWRLMVVGAMAVMLLEVGLSFDRYLSFFNLPSRVYGPERLLGDSNLDWGQDLLRLREWQEKNPETPLYLLYFGTARPEAYGLKFVRLPGTRFSDQPEVLPDASRPGVIVASRMHALGFPLPKPLRDAYAPLWVQEPIGDIGDSLVMYAFPPRSAAAGK